MKFYRDALLLAVLLIAIFSCKQPELQNSAAGSQLVVKLDPAPYPDVPSYIVVLAEGRIAHLLNADQAREFADSVDESQHRLRWDLYNAADQFEDFEQSRLQAQ